MSRPFVRHKVENEGLFYITRLVCLISRDVSESSHSHTSGGTKNNNLSSLDRLLFCSEYSVKLLFSKAVLVSPEEVPSVSQC